MQPVLLTTATSHFWFAMFVFLPIMAQFCCACHGARSSCPCVSTIAWVSDHAMSQSSSAEIPKRGDGSEGKIHRKEQEKQEKLEVLERLAIKGSCVKDGGAVHALLLVAMRPEQKQLLQVSSLSSWQNARLFAFVRRLTVLQNRLCVPRLCSDTERAMLKLQADRQLALATVAHRALALQHLPLEFRDDKEVVLAAVRKKGRALEFAAPRLQGDSEVVLEALQAPGGHRALPFVSERLMLDHRIAAAKAKPTVTPSLTLEGFEEPKVLEGLVHKPVLSQEMLCLLHL